MAVQDPAGEHDRTAAQVVFMAHAHWSRRKEKFSIWKMVRSVLHDSMRRFTMAAQDPSSVLVTAATRTRLFSLPTTLKMALGKVFRKEDGAFDHYTCLEHP